MLWEAKQVWQNMLLLYVLSYIIVRKLPTIITWYFVMDIGSYNNSSSTSIQQQYTRGILCTEHFTCSIFGTTTSAVKTAAADAAAVVVALTLTHCYNAVRGHRTGSLPG